MLTQFEEMLVIGGYTEGGPYRTPRYHKALGPLQLPDPAKPPPLRGTCGTSPAVHVLVKQQIEADREAIARTAELGSLLAGLDGHELADFIWPMLEHLVVLDTEVTETLKQIVAAGCVTGRVGPPWWNVPRRVTRALRRMLTGYKI